MASKDITIKIKGSNRYQNAEEDELEFITDAKFYEKKNTFYVIYDEGAIAGMPGCTTTLKIGQDRVKMKRFSNNKYDLGTEMEFIKGKRFESRYGTEFGPMNVEVLTYNLKNEITSKGEGSLELDYYISLNGMMEGRNKFSLEIM